jgi:AGCS family alanine or glycine:cation symporter
MARLIEHRLPFIMDEFTAFIIQLKDIIWGVPMMTLLIGTGIYLTILLKGVQFRYMGYAFKQVITRKKKSSKGDISHFESLMTSLAGAIGTGSIVGVATAITVGGVGAIFWMWVTAFVGMATKYAESLLAVHYRVVDDRNEMIGGPMQYIERGLGWKWLAILFAFFGAIAAITTGNLVQANAITETVVNVWKTDPQTTGIVLSVLTGLVIIGGVRSIGHVAGVLVPIMALFYLIGGLVILSLNLSALPAAFLHIFESAFSGQAAFGGFAGATVMTAIQIGVARSIFSNESGLGISSIAAAAAITDSPGRQAMINMTGALISTVIVCSITGLVLAVTEVQGALNEFGVPLNGAHMAIEAFSRSIQGGEFIVSIGLILFAFSTVIAWAYYGEKCCEYILGTRSIYPYRLLFTLLVIPGALIKMDLAWHLADIMNGLMAIPNLIALLALSKVIVTQTNEFLVLVKQEQAEK